MGIRPPRERQRLTLSSDATAGGGGPPASEVTLADLIGLDMMRVPQELASHMPTRGTPWPRGTCLPAVATPDGRQTLCFGTINELRPLSCQWRGGVPLNSARTLWVVTLRD
jgi:hypothetical protein